MFQTRNSKYKSPGDGNSPLRKQASFPGGQSLRSTSMVQDRASLSRALPSFYGFHFYPKK